MSDLRIAIIGCGAVTAQAHLPVLARLDGVRPTLLVDRNLARAESLAQQFGIARAAADYSAAFTEADAAVVALPHYLHAPVSVALLQRGIHVLVEKPMALTAAECAAMIEAAEQGRAVLAVGLMRRFLRSTRWARAAVQAGLLGPVRSFDVREGFIYNWPVASDFFFRKETAGGGVLIDTGAHTLDSLLWWLGDVRSFEYFDDNCGGVEADCRIQLEMTSGATGIVELSRTRQLRNTAIIEGELATLEVSWADVRLTPRPDILTLSGIVKSVSRSGNDVQEYLEVMADSLTDWVDAIRTNRPPAVTGAEGMRSVALIENCYKQRQPLELAWNATGSERVPELVGGLV